MTTPCEALVHPNTQRCEWGSGDGLVPETDQVGALAGVGVSELELGGALRMDLEQRLPPRDHVAHRTQESHARRCVGGCSGALRHACDLQTIDSADAAVGRGL